MTVSPTSRRKFITLLGGAVAAPSLGWPREARAEQAGRMRRVGVLKQTTENDPEGKRHVAAFTQALDDLGWKDGRNIRIEYRWTANNSGRAQTFAKELVGLRADVVLAVGTLQLRSLSRETRSIPIVFVQVTDPVGEGFVKSLARPGGNITGFSSYDYTMGGKWLELLKEIAPSVSRVLVVMAADNPASPSHLRTIKGVADRFGVQVTAAGVHDLAELERVIDSFAGEANGGLIMLPGLNFAIGGAQVTRLATRHRLPAISTDSALVTQGLLLSYGADPTDQHRSAASYVDRILRGEKLSDLPVQYATKFELVINLKTAKSLGLAVLLTLQARADEVIE